MKLIITSLIILSGLVTKAQSSYSKAQGVLPNGNYYIINVASETSLACPTSSSANVLLREPDAEDPYQLLSFKKSGKGYTISLTERPEYSMWFYPADNGLTASDSKKPVFIVTDAGDGSYFFSTSEQLGRAYAAKNSGGVYEKVLLGNKKSSDEFKWLIVPENQINGETENTYVQQEPAYIEQGTGNSSMQAQTETFGNDTPDPIVLPESGEATPVNGKANIKKMVVKHAKEILKETGVEDKLKAKAQEMIEKIKTKANKIIGE